MTTHWKRDFFTLLAGQAVSILTSAVVQFAIILWLTDKTGSPLVLSIATLFGFLPQAIIGPFAGAFVDRHSRKKIMMLADGMIALVSLVLVIYGIFGEIPVWLVLGVLFVRSLGSAFHLPASQAVTPLIVPQQWLTKCNGYAQATQSISTIISPALGAMLYSMIKLNFVIGVDVIGAVIGISAVAIIKIPELKNLESHKTHMLHDLREGLSILWQHRGLFWIAVVCSAFMLFFMPVSALFPLMSTTHFSGGAWHISLIESMFSVGMLGGSLVLGIWGGFKNRMNTIFFAYFLVGVTLLVSALLPQNGFYLFVILTCLMGASGALFNAPSITIIQETIAPEFLGRVLSLFTSMSMLAGPVGLIISGFLAEHTGVNFWFALSGIVSMVLSLTCFIPIMHRCGLPKKAIDNPEEA